MRAPEKVFTRIRIRQIIKQKNYEVMNEDYTGVMWNVCSVRCGVAARTLSRVRERSDAAVQRESAGRREPPPASERLPPGPPRAPRPRHARATHRLHRHTRPCRRTPRAELPTLFRARSGLTHHAIIDVFCEMCREEQGPRGAARTAGARRGRGSGPARCVTHLSRRFLACSRSPPSAETCCPGSLGAARARTALSLRRC